MFCPSCKDEFRSGFTRCEGCGVDLVHELPRGREVPPPPIPVVAVATFVDYCGYIQLDDAREARELLRGKKIQSEILIRDAPEGRGEEYWLRVDAAKVRQAHDLLGAGEEPEAETAEPDDSDFNCSECGATVPGSATSCPGCGARFEES